MVINNIKLNKFIIDYIERINNNDISKSNYIYNILKNCSYSFKNNMFDNKLIALYFTDEQLDLIKTKQEELGYENNFSRFVRYALFDDFMKNHNINIINKEFYNELINYDKFNSLMIKCKNELINGNFTSYNLNLLRDNKEYKDKISIYKLNNDIEKEPFNANFLEYDILNFLNYSFREGNIYSELVDLSTEQIMHKVFIELENGEKLEPFIDYDNIVPNTNSFYYLFIYYVFNDNKNIDEDFKNLNIDEIFNETEEHIDSLLKKYTFEKIIRYYKQKNNIIDINLIFDKECIENLLYDNIITYSDIIKQEDIIKQNDIIKIEGDIKSNKNIESNLIIESNENIKSNKI